MGPGTPERPTIPGAVVGVVGVAVLDQDMRTDPQPLAAAQLGERVGHHASVVLVISPHVVGVDAARECDEVVEQLAMCLANARHGPGLRHIEPITDDHERVRPTRDALEKAAKQAILACERVRPPPIPEVQIADEANPALSP